MEAAKIGLAMIGCGQIARAHLRAIEENPHAKLTAAMDVIEERAIETAEKYDARAYTSVEDALNDANVDAVVLPLPHHLHHPVTIQAAEAGKHILVEKPMALNLDEARQMVDAAESAGVKLIDESPRDGAHGMKIAFAHPSSTGGVLTEFCRPE